MVVSLKIRLLSSQFAGRAAGRRQEGFRVDIIVQGKVQLEGSRGIARPFAKRLSPWQGLIVMPLEDVHRGEEAHVDVDQGGQQVSISEAALALGRNPYQDNHTRVFIT